MSVYVDPLMDHGWILRGKLQKSCHMFADTVDELHSMAGQICLKRKWFQDAVFRGGRREDRFILPHYDLTLSKRRDAIRAGVIQVSKREAVNIWRKLGADED